MIQTIKELKEKRMNITTQSRSFLNELEIKLKEESRKMTQEEKTKLDNYDDEITRLDDEIDIAERKLKIENDMRSDTPTAGDEQPYSPDTGDNQDEIHERAFGKYIVNSPDFNDDEIRSLHTGSDQDGGYVISPQKFIKKLIKKLETITSLRPYANVISINQGDSIGVPSLEDEGDDARWTAEIELVKESNSVKLGKRELKTNQLTKLVKIARKLTRISAMPLEDLILQILSKKIGAAENKSFVIGSGSGEPLGVCHKNSEISQLTGKIDYDFFIDVQEDLDEGYNPMWVFRNDVIKSVRKLKDGNGQYIHHPSTEPGAPDKILESVYIKNKHVPDDLIGVYGDFSYYWILDSLKLEIQKIIELFSLTNQIGFLARKETDGMVVNKEAFRIMKQQG